MKPVVTQINEKLAALGRAERLARGRGYYYLRGGEASRFFQAGLYGTEYPLVNFDRSWAGVKSIFAENGIDLSKPPLERALGALLKGTAYETKDGS